MVVAGTDAAGVVLPYLAHQLLALVGESGSGRSTTAVAATSLLPPTARHRLRKA